MMKRIVLLLAMCVVLSGQVCLAGAEVGKEVTAVNGLKITVLTAGKGGGAEAGDKLTMNYTGWLYADGKKGNKFDSSLKPGGKPLPLTLGTRSVIPGWEQGLLGIKAGEKRRLLIPSDLAYGAQGRPPVIPANATLLFEVECVTLLKSSTHEDLKVGEGARATSGHFVTLRFVGKELKTGKVFVDRRKKGYRYALGAQMFLPAWDKHIIGMKVGGKRKVSISGHEIYGGQGIPRLIGAGLDAEFEVELVKVEDGVTQKTIKGGEGRVSKDGDIVRYHLKFTKDSLMGEQMDTRDREAGKPLLVKLVDSDALNPMMYLLGMKAGGVRQVVLPWQWGALLAEPREFRIELTLVSFEDEKPTAVIKPAAKPKG